MKKEKIKIIDDCLVPDRFLWLNYTGHNPWGVAKHISSMIKPFFHVSSSGTSNTRINWDVVGENVSFYSVWWVNRKLSGNTAMVVNMKVIGKKSKATNQGNFTFQINANLETNFGGWAHWFKPLWLIYSYLFYHRVRRAMIQRCRNSVVNFREEIKKHYNIETAQGVPTATGTYG
jgi:hypothetical protein